MRLGATRTYADKRDLSFSRSFGAMRRDLSLLNYDYNKDVNMPDQVGEGYPLGCRAFTLAEIANDQDDAIYKKDFTASKIALYEGTDQILGGDIRNAMKVGQAYGVQRIDETTDGDALKHRRGRYYSVDKVNGMDWFDSFRVALRDGKSPISIGTIWFPEWLNTGQDGILTEHFVFDGTWDYEAGHNYKICGEKVINGRPHLVAKVWLGRSFGDNGWCYFSRETFNKAFDIYGTVAFIQPPFTPKDTFTVQLTLLQFALQYLARLIGKKLAGRISDSVYA